MKYTFPIILLYFFIGCSQSTTTRNNSTHSDSVKSTLLRIREFDYRATTEGDSAYLDSAYSLLIQGKMLEHFDVGMKEYEIVLAILAKKKKWKEIIDLLEPYGDDLDDTLYVVKNYTKYNYFMLKGDTTQANNYLQENLDFMYKKKDEDKNIPFWIHEISRHIYLLHGLDSARSYLETIGGKRLEYISLNKDIAIQTLLQNIKEQYGL